jgi:hypothetical protein
LNSDIISTPTPAASAICGIASVSALEEVVESLLVLVVVLEVDIW